MPFPGLPLAPTEPLPKHRLLAPTEPPDNQPRVFVPSASSTTVVAQVPRGASWYARVALSIAIVIAVVAIAAIS